jgi:electron transfer flavoprotein beta subunit
MAAHVAVLLKRVDLRPEVDPLTGATTHDPHGGLSAADECALELALRTAEAEATGVLAVSAGTGSADAVLRTALECGASEAVRVGLPADAPSAIVAEAVAPVVASCRWIWCGDHSLDRGSGAVPAFVAGRLGVRQALGLLAVDLPSADGSQEVGGSREAYGSLEVERRLDGGRREVLSLAPPAVLSVESHLVRLRRPSLPATLRAADLPIRVIQTWCPPSVPGRTMPFRPRARVLAGPDPELPVRDRLLALSGALVDHEPPRLVQADPGEAADEILEFLRRRGYLDQS